jgi:hypothetical protein
MDKQSGVFVPLLLTQAIQARYPNLPFSIEAEWHPESQDGAVAQSVRVVSSDLFNETEMASVIEENRFQSYGAAVQAAAGRKAASERAQSLIKSVRATLRDNPRDIVFFSQTRRGKDDAGLVLPFSGQGEESASGIIDRNRAALVIPTSGEYRLKLRLSVAFDGLNAQDSHDAVYVWVARNAEPDTVSEIKYTRLPFLVFNPDSKVGLDAPMLGVDECSATLSEGDVLDVRFATLDQTPALYAIYVRELSIERL